MSRGESRPAPGEGENGGAKPAGKKNVGASFDDMDDDIPF